ncbi:hypothetical protein [Pseudomonas lijiangensis]|nr:MULTISPECIES: hypothetical protein [Pseudomonas syringae group]
MTAVRGCHQLLKQVFDAGKLRAELDNIITGVSQKVRRTSVLEG